MAAAFSMALLRKKFSRSDWVSFVVLFCGWAAVRTHSSLTMEAPAAPAIAQPQPVLGVILAFIAAAISGFAGVFLEAMYTRGSAAIELRLLQLCIFTLPIQMMVLIRAVALRPNEGLLVGFRMGTWILIALGVAGAFATAHALKHAGNISMIFAVSNAWFMSAVCLGAKTTPLFWLGAVALGFATFLFEGLRLMLEGARKKQLQWISKFARVEEDDADQEGEGQNSRKRRPPGLPPCALEMDSGENSPPVTPRDGRASANEISIRGAVAALDSPEFKSDRAPTTRSPGAPHGGTGRQHAIHIVNDMG